MRARAQRMGLAAAPVKLAAETALRDIVEALKRDRFDLVEVIDPIQTLWSDQLEAGPGSVAQVRAAAGELVRLAKKRGTAVVLVGHVTKDGQDRRPVSGRATWSTPCSPSRASAATRSASCAGRKTKLREATRTRSGWFEMSDAACAG